MSRPRHPRNWHLAAAVCWLAATLASSAQGLEPENYILRAQDIVDVKVYQEDDLSLRALINRDGTVRLPLVGPLRLAGLTVNQAAEKIRGAYLGDYLIDPQVTVAVAQFARRRVTVLGQVARPGALELRPGETMTLLQAIGEAGGFARLANPKAVVVKRQEGGRERVHIINVKEMATNPQAAPFLLQEGDVITVKEALF